MNKKKVDLLYVSSLCSDSLLKEILNKNLGNPNLAAQKYHRLLVEGIGLNKDLFKINVIGIPEYNYSQKKIFRLTNSDIENEIEYNYAPLIFIPLIKWVVISIYLFYKIFIWRFKGNKNEKFIVFDILNLSTSIVSTISSKLFRLKTVTIVTDLPEMMYILQPKVFFINKLTYLLKNFLMKCSDGYVFLTKQMNTYVNTNNKPYVIIEGLADINSNNIYNTLNINSNKNYNKIIHYSGGLYEKFGVKMLIDSFMLIKREDIRLHIFGIGDMTEYILKCKAIDKRIEFFGYKHNSIVLSDQLNSTLLINPRFSKGMYNNFSFPSKTIEYMSSGVPLLTTQLPGIPFEYFNFVYLLEDESIIGYKNTIEKILNIPKSELNEFGSSAKKFILNNKNNKIQAQKFYDIFSLSI